MEYNPRYAKLAEFIRENAHLMADGTLDKLYEEVRIHNLDWVPYLTLLMNSIGISPEDRLREIPKFFGYYINIPIHIPEGITAIGDLAYTGNPYQGELVIPGSVETIGEQAIQGKKKRYNQCKHKEQYFYCLRYKNACMRLICFHRVLLTKNQTSVFRVLVNLIRYLLSNIVYALD